jgi:hypothetical protein
MKELACRFLLAGMQGTEANLEAASRDARLTAKPASKPFTLPQKP